MSEFERSNARYPSRREVIALGVGAFVIGAVPLARWRRTRRLVRRTIPVMGTIAEVAIVHRDEQYAEAAIDAALDELRYVDRVMTRFSPSSDVGRVNRFAAAEGVAVSASTADVLRAALAWAERTSGAFDPCLGRAIELWDVDHRHTPPAPERVRRLADRHLYRALDVDRDRVRLTDRDAEVDLGGIGKGYAVDRAVTVLREWGITQAFVNAGGDLYALGASDDGDPWEVGIQSPDAPDTLAGSIHVSDAAVATSGDYLQYFDYHGHRYHHLLDPATGAPRESSVRSVTVQANRCMTADAAATAVFGLAPDAAARAARRAAPDAKVVRVL